MSARARWLSVITLVAAAALIVQTARLGEDMTPTSDIAVIETFTRLAEAGNLDLGPYSRFQWHHPGPAYFFAMAPAYAAAGEKPTALDAAALLLNLAGLAIALWFTSRYGSAALGTVVAGAIVLLVLRVPELLISPWNAHIPLIAAMAMLPAAAAAMTGRPAALGVVALTASLAGQTHVALLPVAVTVGGAAVADFVVAAWRSGASAGHLARGLAIAGATAAAAWAPAVYEQLTHSPGNLTLIWRYFVVEPHHGQTWGVALSAWADMISGALRPDFYLAHGWRFVESPVRWAEAVALTELVALLGVVFRARRQHRSFDAAFAAVLLGASLLSLLATTRIDGEVFDHAVFWIAGIGVLNLAAITAAAVNALAGSRTVARVWLLGVSACAMALTITLVVGIAELNLAVAASRSPNAESQAAAAVAVDLRRVIADRGLSRPLVRFDQDAWGMAAGVVLRLQKEHIAVAVEDDWLAMYTPAFAATGREDAELSIVGKAAHIRLAAPDTLVASSGDLLFAHLTSR